MIGPVTRLANVGQVAQAIPHSRMAQNDPDARRRANSTAFRIDASPAAKLSLPDLPRQRPEHFRAETLIIITPRRKLRMRRL